MKTLFYNLMYKEIEVYVDDMNAKSQTEEEHVDNLLKLFQRFRKCHLCLNPINAPSVSDQGSCWVLLSSKRESKLILIKFRQFKKSLHQEMKSKLEVSLDV